VLFDVQGRLAFFRHCACRSYWMAYLNAFICLQSSFTCRYRERENDCNRHSWLLSLIFLLLSSMGVFVKIGFFSIGMPTSSLLLLLLLSCQLSFYTCSLQFRKDLSFLFFSYSILLIVTCIYLRCCPTAVLQCCSFSRRRKKSKRTTECNRYLVQKKKRRRRKTIRKNFCHHFLALYFVLDCTIFPLFSIPICGR
jgi:hypothetical protein